MADTKFEGKTLEYGQWALPKGADAERLMIVDWDESSMKVMKENSAGEYEWYYFFEIAEVTDFINGNS